MGNEAEEDREYRLQAAKKRHSVGKLQQEADIHDFKTWRNNGKLSK